MKILVTGASGLIGSEVCARLVCEGNDVVRLRHRPPRVPDQSTVVVDMANAVRPQDWVQHLIGIDAVVNCAGVLQDSASEDTHNVHSAGAAALFFACEQVGIRKVLHFSAIGIDRAQPSAFSASKLAGDEALMERDLDWVILRPSVVLGRAAFGASALFRGLAALPVLPVMPFTGPLQVVQLDDVVATVIFLLRPKSPSRIALELAGPEALAMSEIVERYRRWLGWKQARKFVLPVWAGPILYRFGDLAGWLGWRPPVRTTAAREIARGATGDPQPWTMTTGIHPTSLSSALDATPATVQERWFAGLYFLKPTIFLVLASFWIMTGIISLTTGWRSGVDMLIDTVVGGLAEWIVAAGAGADVIIGTLIAWRPMSWVGLWGAIATSLFYVIAGTVLRPDLWNAPLGPLTKILPILILHFVALAVLEER